MWIKRYIFFHGKRHPREMGGAFEVERFLSDLATRRKVAASTQNQAVQCAAVSKDRVTMLPGGVKGPLAEHLKRVKLLHEQDLAAGHGRVYLPYALSQRYPAADREWGLARDVFPAVFEDCAKPEHGRPFEPKLG